MRLPQVRRLPEPSNGIHHRIPQFRRKSEMDFPSRTQDRRCNAGILPAYTARAGFSETAPSCSQWLLLYSKGAVSGKPALLLLRDMKTITSAIYLLHDVTGLRRPHLEMHTRPSRQIVYETIVVWHGNCFALHALSQLGNGRHCK